MAKTLKKTTISIMMIVVIIINIPSLIANAETLSGSNLDLQYNFSNGLYSVSLTNYGIPRYVGLSILVYNNSGVYVTSNSNSGILKNGETGTLSGYAASGYHITINVTVYNGTSPYTPVLYTGRTSFHC